MQGTTTPTTTDIRRYCVANAHQCLKEFSNGGVDETQLAENCAHHFDHDEWLDDETHEVWEIALNVAEAYERSHYR